MNIVSGNALAEIASLMGDPARANIICALMDGRALTAGELAWHAGVTPQTTSGHLSKLLDARLAAVEKQGRHRYYRLASPEIARAVESLMTLASMGPARYRPTGPKDEAMRAARTCYDHLAGRLGTAMADALFRLDYVRLSPDGEGLGSVTERGTRFLCGELGLDLGSGGKRPLCRTCLDWSERRPHVAGRLGAALCEHALGVGWIERVSYSRAITVTPIGRDSLLKLFDVRLT